MGLFLRQEDNRSQLQSKIVAELQRKTRENSHIEGSGETEPTLLENQHETRTAGLVIGLLMFALLIVVLFVVARSR